MTKIRLKNIQTAQGMVEFALVLPILLLLILGIFAFGHLFFTYSSLVSASREAARWGAAVGGVPGESPRYSDCNSIRGTAVRIGAFAGVNMSDIEEGNDSDTGIEITYDKGPGTPLFDTGCPLDGPGPEDVDLGDRIRVRVRVMYQPPVPVVNLPSFPLEATTFRTILKSVPVGEVPTAVDPCIMGTDTLLWAEPDTSAVGSETPSVVGQAVTWHVQVSPQTYSADPEPFTGDILIYDLDDPDNKEICKSSADNPLSTSGEFSCTLAGTNYTAARTIHAKAQYIPSGSCFVASENTTAHVVNPAQTNISIIPPSFLQVKQSMTFKVTVLAIDPGKGIPTGIVSFKFGPFAPEDLTLAPDPDGINAVASITLPPAGISAGTYTVTATYQGDGNYATSTATITVIVYDATPTVGPTLTLTPTRVVSTPTNTAVPAYCPRVEPSSYDIFQIGNALQFPIYNPNVSGSSNTDVKSVEIWWPGDPTAQLQEIRFGAAVDSCLKTGGNKNCLFQTTALDPTHQVVTSSTPGWDNQFAGINKNVTKFMRLFFNHSMPQGSYHLRISFSNNCVLDFSRDKVTP